ncbi:WD40 repeat-like protein [Decorospora gaudefroyi]|uniref:WD40 repeat-like protein n=1 Tax=Decorospora gaudefroyi TaxID=184978 RepID=A0A6A5JXT1_9PLEO|nr:WD40 repeat-like protein [Decorospora gaudefroyi]
MAEARPKATVPDPPATSRGSFQKQETALPTTVNDIPGPVASPSNKKFAAKLRSPASTPVQPYDTYNGHGPRLSETPIDPLSQQILERTNTSPAVQKLRSQTATTEPAPSQSPILPNEASADKEQIGETPRDTGASKTDKKKVSFLSRFIGGSKKKTTLDDTSDNGPEADDLRREGMDAQLYVDNFSFSPKMPHPPAYIKVRAKFKKEKEFDRVFLAQELRSGSDKKSPPAAGSNPAPQSGSAATHNPIWAVEFSKDGRYLAAGGQDRLVRVWAVIASPEERRVHEHAESDPHVFDSEARHLSAPVFQQKPVRQYQGHTSTILDLSWSKNNFLLSSSMDKTVRLWHVSREENLCTFKHSDFVPSIQFHPTDDRFFLAGSLDAKLRLWSIPDKSVAFPTTVPDMVTAVAFTPDGKTCIAGTLGGLCIFYDTEGLKWQSQLHVKSTRGQNAKGSKITGIQATYWPPGSETGDVKLLVSSNDSRLRIYNMKDKTLEMKFRGHENNCSQIRATFSGSSGHIICGSEDRKTYIWSTATPEGEKRNQRPVEMFEAHNSITTCTVMAPIRTRQLLGASEDPIFDLCNPPPVTLVSRAESLISSRAPTEAGSAHPTPTPTDASFKRATESPAYIARSAHRGGNIIVTADYTGALKVFRQDCAFNKRIRMSETWDTASLKRGSGLGGRSSSIISRTSRSRRDSVSTQPPNDRIMTWRQGISHGSFDSSNSLPRRNASPRKSMAAPPSLMSTTQSQSDSPILRPTRIHDAWDSRPTATPTTSMSISRTVSETESPLTETADGNLIRQNDSSHPMAPYDGYSALFWTSRGKSVSTAGSEGRDGSDLHERRSNLSKMTDEMSEQ